MSKILSFGLACLILVVGYAYATESPVVVADPRLAIARVEGKCTGEVVVASGDLLITASHCVGTVGADVTLVFRDSQNNRIAVTGKLIWDGLPSLDGSGNYSEIIDLAIVRLPRPWMFYLPVLEGDAVPNSEGLTVGYSAGFVFYTAFVRIWGVMEHETHGHVAVYRGDVLPGASGSVVLVNGQAVGMITHGVLELNPPLIWGPTSRRILAALADLRVRGDMVKCVETQPDGKTVTKVCRAQARASN